MLQVYSHGHEYGNSRQRLKTFGMGRFARCYTLLTVLQTARNQSGADYILDSLDIELIALARCDARDFRDRSRRLCRS